LAVYSSKTRKETEAEKRKQEKGDRRQEAGDSFAEIGLAIWNFEF